VLSRAKASTRPSTGLDRPAWSSPSNGREAQGCPGLLPRGVQGRGRFSLRHTTAHEITSTKTLRSARRGPSGLLTAALFIDPAKPKDGLLLRRILFGRRCLLRRLRWLFIRALVG
jgi:hypothetical protein